MTSVMNFLMLCLACICFQLMCLRCLLVWSTAGQDYGKVLTGCLLMVARWCAMAKLVAANWLDVGGLLQGLLWCVCLGRGIARWMAGLMQGLMVHCLCRTACALLGIVVWYGLGIEVYGLLGFRCYSWFMSCRISHRHVWLYVIGQVDL